MNIPIGSSGSSARLANTVCRVAIRLCFCLLPFALPAIAQWRTGYFLQAEAAGQTAATIPWQKYTHIIHSALRPTYTNGVCSLDSSSALLSTNNVTDFIRGAHAWG